MLGHAKQPSSPKSVPIVLPLRIQWDGSLLQIDPTSLNPHTQFVFISIFFNLPQLSATNPIWIPNIVNQILVANKKNMIANIQIELNDEAKLHRNA